MSSGIGAAGATSKSLGPLSNACPRMHVANTRAHTRVWAAQAVPLPRQEVQRCSSWRAGHRGEEPCRQGTCTTRPLAGSGSHCTNTGVGRLSCASSWMTGAHTLSQWEERLEGSYVSTSVFTIRPSVEASTASFRKVCTGVCACARGVCVCVRVYCACARSLTTRSQDGPGARTQHHRCSALSVHSGRVPVTHCPFGFSPPACVSLP